MRGDVQTGLDGDGGLLYGSGPIKLRWRRKLRSGVELERGEKGVLNWIIRLSNDKSARIGTEGTKD